MLVALQQLFSKNGHRSDWHLFEVFGFRHGNFGLPAESIGTPAPLSITLMPASRENWLACST